MKEEEIEQLAKDILNGDYSRMTFTSRLYDMFAKDSDSIEAYIKPGRHFWHWEDGRREFRRLTVTYVRTGVMFFVFDDSPEEEHAWFISSFNCNALCAEEIYPYEIGELLSKQYKDAKEDFPKICKQCKWDTSNDRITVKVIWDEGETTKNAS